MRLAGLVMLIAIAPLAACSQPDRSAADAGPTDAMQLTDATQPTDGAPSPDAAPMLTVPDGTYLDQLTPDQANALCTWMADVQGGPRTIDCGGGTMVTIDPVADCLQNPWPHCQVGLLRPCIEAQATDECASAPPACMAFYQCAGG